MDDFEKKRQLFANYPYHIAILVKAAQRVIKEGLMRIEDGELVINSEKAGGEEAEKRSASDGK